MKKVKTNNRKIAVKALSVITAAAIAASFFVGDGKLKNSSVYAGKSTISDITEVTASYGNDLSSYYDENVTYKLPENVNGDEIISVIVKLNTDSVLDAYEKTAKDVSVSDYVLTAQAASVSKNVETERKKLIKKLSASGINYTLGEIYDTVLGGFEINLKASDFAKAGKLFGSDATLIVGDVYEESVTTPVTNDVDVYDTGIFDSSSLEYKGDGVVVAVLDTGLDYTHTAFSVKNFESSDKRFTLGSVSEKVGRTTAASFSAGLTGEDVYVNEKVPYAYDYADKDSDVLPINSEHGTHVAGIIAGKDNEITGVAPRAQLAIMKVFSDAQTGAKTSWILAAIEDCVVLGVDVINMSLGTSCGFTREVDKQNVERVYDKVKQAGISLITAASNDYNSTMGSEKNGNNGLTSNPDSGTVGSPSTYEGALSVASVDGVKTPYLRYGNEIIYFNEATNSAAKKKDFVAEVLKAVGDPSSYEFDYVTIPGIGRSSDYVHDASYYQGKIVLVKRGTTTFEDKIRVALKEKGAAGVIIYNNVSGTISMSAGADVGAACSISQDDGEKLAKNTEGKIIVSKANTAGPFMSDFSSWGPTSDLKIKPEITAHGGEIYSAVPGQAYDRLSGTSMAAPNLAGAAALIRQYVKKNENNRFGLDGLSGTEKDVKVTALVNQLMMSTADIVYNKNGLPYAVRKQGAGLINIQSSVTTASYITTYENGTAMDKSKLELGDDKAKSGVYTATFDITNISSSAVAYDVSHIIQTEGVSATYTSHGETVVTQEGYLLSGSQISVTSVTGGGTGSGARVTVNANSTAKVSVEIRLSEEDKRYMDNSFEHGMYVEGFIKFTASQGTTVNINLPLLAFYGDWTEAPILDEEYYDTNKDEINAGLDPEDKMMPDAYATRVVGGLYSDYIHTLGTYGFIQNPSSSQIAADKNKISMSIPSNSGSGTESAVTSIRSISAGLLRNVGELKVTVTEDSTGREVWTKTIYNQRKSHSSGGTIYASSVDLDFSALEQNLKNNTQYTVKMQTYIDYGENSEQKNARSVFEFPLFIDFQAPTVTGVTYRTEYDSTTYKTKLYADIDIYDNHYAMAAQLGQIINNPEYPASSPYQYTMTTFGKYMTPVYSEFNSTSRVSIEITDYVEAMKKSVGPKFSQSGTTMESDNNSFIIACYDYAMNSATYQIKLPDEILGLNFSTDEIKLSLNETLRVADVLSVYPSESWLETLDYEITDANVARIVNGTLLAVGEGETVLTAKGKGSDGKTISKSVKVKVEGDNGYTIPEVNKFAVTGYKTVKSYYGVVTDDREIGKAGSENYFGATNSLSMFPSETVRLKYTLDSYFENKTKVVFETGDPSIATVAEDGTIIAKAKGDTVIMATVYYGGNITYYSDTIAVTVKDPFNINSIYLMNYRGLGGTVEIPADRGVTTIYAYAFSQYEYVEKDLAAGDVIDEEDPYYIKQHYIGQDKDFIDPITKVVIPEGVTEIQSYAFANLQGLKEVVLPSTLTKIGTYAFYNCTSLVNINLENVKFINEGAFENCGLTDLNFKVLNAIGNNSFKNNNLIDVTLPESSQSLGIGAFSANEKLQSVTFKADKIKIGSGVFTNCPKLTSIKINAAVIAARAFEDCKALTNVTLGKDVAVIGEYAFAGTNVSKFTVEEGCAYKAENGGAVLTKNNELALVAPKASFTGNKFENATITSIANGAFSGKTNITSIVAPNVTKVGAYAFAGCSVLSSATFGSLKEIGAHAFEKTILTNTDFAATAETIGDYAFADCANLQTVTVGANAEVGQYAFKNATALQSVTIGNGAVIGDYAFYCAVNLSYTYENIVYVLQRTQGYVTVAQVEAIFSNYYTTYQYEIKNENGDKVATKSYRRYNIEKYTNSALKTLTAGENVKIGNYAFAGNVKLETVTLGNGANIGDYAFYNASSLTAVDLSGVKSIGAYAFSGSQTYDFACENNEYSVAYEITNVNGENVITGRKVSVFASAVSSADLGSIETLGAGAFMGNSRLASVNFGDKLTVVPQFAFANTALTATGITDKISAVGAYAYYDTAVTAANLAKVNVIGAYAFCGAKLTEVTLANGAIVADGAFANNFDLTAVNGLDKAVYIGAQAFAYTALGNADLTSAEYIGDFAFENSAIGGVKLGDKLAELGENPFAGTLISSFGKNADIIFAGNKVGEEFTENYDVSATVKVIGGVLYQNIATGLELVSYPTLKEGGTYEAAEGTVRISAKAFTESKIYSVVMPRTLLAIGDKAFYNCEKLATVAFKGYYAPALEEEFDSSYASTGNVPYSEKYGGLGINDYYMWNVSSDVSNYYYGANFVNRIGKIDSSLTMVKPANGKNYDSLIFSLYFDRIVNGANAATDDTLKVIAVIAALPTEISLADEAQVVAARNAFDNLGSLEQQALVENYADLQNAESIINYLKQRQDSSDSSTDSSDTTSDSSSGGKKKGCGSCKGAFGGAGVMLSLAALGLGAFIVKKKKS